MRRISMMFDRAARLGLDRLDRFAQRRYAAAPLCDRPLGSEADYLRLWHEARSKAHPSIDAYERECRAAIDAGWFDRLGLLTQVTIKRSAICYQHGRVLYATLARYLRVQGGQHLNIVETGTARGFSALCLARALADAGASGKIFTFDVLPHNVPIYWNCCRDVEGPRARADLLRDYADLIEKHVVFHQGDTRLALRKVAFPRVHLTFLDSVHTYDHVLSEFAHIGGRQQRGDLTIFDDYTAYPGVALAADEICSRYGYSATVIAANPQRGYLIAEKR